MTIEDKLLAVMRDIKGIEKNRKNEAMGYTYRGIDDVYNELHALFAKHGILVIPEVVSYEKIEREVLRNGRKLTAVHVYVQVKYTFIDEVGHRMSTFISGEGIDTGDKGLYKALSGAQKYLLLQMFLIPTEAIVEPEDDSLDILADEKEGPKKENHVEKIPENQVQKTEEPGIAFGELLTKMANAETKEALKTMYIDAVRTFRDKDKINKIIAVKDLRMSQLDAKVEKTGAKKQEKYAEKVKDEQAEKEKEEQGGIFF